MPQIPNHVSNYNVFKDGNRLLGVADITLPALANLTASLKGASIPGEIDMPVQCHWQAASVTINWHTVTDNAVYTIYQDGANLDIWAAHQYHDTAENKIIHKGWRYVLGTVPKSFNLGNLEVGTTGGVSTELELITCRILFDGVEQFALDKGNFIVRVGGVPFGDRIRQLIGL